MSNRYYVRLLLKIFHLMQVGGTL